MAYFDVINREYVNPMDLNILGNTFNTLEKGHQEAIKAASNLEIEMSKFNLNEAESAWRQQKINEIKDIVANNTVYGNAYGSLDDLIAKAGNIVSDPGMIGRLKAQQDYEIFQKELNSANIPEGMKEMYRQENPYHYEDTYDEQGNIIGGTKWQPNTRPVNTIDRFKFMQEAKSILTAEKGNYQNIQFLDAAGNPTSDPSKSVDGAMYKQEGTTWVKLSKDKIKEAIEVARKTVAGAEDSFQQDYRYEQWKYNNAVKQAIKNGGDTTPYVEGFTDNDGNVLDYESWLDSQFDAFADKAKYTHTTTDVKFGTALENKRTRDLQAAQVASEGSSSIQDLILNGTLGGGSIGNIKVEGNAYAAALNVKDSSNKQGLDLLKSIDEKAFANIKNISEVVQNLMREGNATNEGSAANYLISKYGDKLSLEQRNSIINSFTAYGSANNQINEMMKKAGVDADYLKFSANVANQVYTNDNEYGKKIIDILNNSGLANKNIKYTIGKNVFNSLKQLYNVNDLKDAGLNYSINEDGTYNIEFYGKNRNLLPKFAYEINKADDINSGWSIGNFLKRTVGIITDDSFEVNFNGANTHIALKNLYTEGLDKSSKVESKVGIGSGYRNILGTDAGSIGEIYIRANGLRLGYTPSEQRARIEQANSNLDRQFAAGNFSNGVIYSADEGGFFTKDITKAQDYTNLIQHMYQRYPNIIKRVYTADNIIDKHGNVINGGYYLTFTVPNNDNDDIASTYAGKQFKLLVSGTLDEGYNYNPAENASNIANNLMITSNATNQPIENLGYDNDLGDTRIINNKGKYEINLLGHKKEVDYFSAQKYAETMIELNRFKYSLKAGLYPNQELIKNSAKALINDLYNITGLDVESLENSILRFIKRND